MKTLSTVMKTNPWNSINNDIENLIDKVIMELNPGTGDDLYCQMCEDPDKIKEAKNYIRDKLC